MRLVKALLVTIVVVAVIGGVFWQVWLKEQVAYARLATAYGAKMVCSCRFVAGREMESCLTDFTADVGAVRFEESRSTIRASVFGLVSDRAVHTPGTGCTLVP